MIRTKCFDYFFGLFTAVWIAQLSVFKILTTIFTPHRK